jgi:hypothetical protein
LHSRDVARGRHPQNFPAEFPVCRECEPRRFAVDCFVRHAVGLTGASQVAAGGSYLYGIYSARRQLHVKTLASQKRRMLLTSRQLLQAKALDIENDLRGTLRNFGLKVGVVGTVKFEARIRELVANRP